MSHDSITMLDDLKFIKSILNKNIKVETRDNVTHVGIFCAFDPESKAVVIKNDSLHILLGHAIVALEVVECNETEVIEDLPKEEVTVEDIELKKEWVKGRLHKNYINVVEDGEILKLGDDLIIEPPYEKENCYCSNTIILQRVHDVLMKMKPIHSMPVSFK